MECLCRVDLQTKVRNVVELYFFLAVPVSASSSAVLLLGRVPPDEESLGAESVLVVDDVCGLVA